MFLRRTRLFVVSGVITLICWIVGPPQLTAQVIYTVNPVINYYRPNPLLRPRTFVPSITYGATVAQTPIIRPYIPLVAPAAVASAYVAPVTSYPSGVITSYLPPVSTALYAPTPI